MKHSSALGVVILVLDIASVVSVAGEKAARPEIFLSNVVPVVNKELELRVFPDKGVALPSKAALTITFEGKPVLREEVEAAKGKFVKKWTPPETGFYTATFDFGHAGGVGKVSREFPVVWRELYFIVWGPPSPKEASEFGYLIQHVITEDDKTIPFWHARGAKVLRYVSGAQYYPTRTFDKKTAGEMLANFSAPMKKGYDGIFIDELGEYPIAGQLERAISVGKVLIQLRKENPDMILMPAVGGALLREEAISHKYAGSIALLETYPTCFTRYFGSHSIKKHINRRIETARNTDLIYQVGSKCGAIILLGARVDAPHEEPILPELEEFVRHIKRHAPEMPGIGFYGGRGEGGLEAEKRLIHDYYIKPVVDLRAIRFSDYSPRAGEAVDILLGIHNLGGMAAKGISVKLYAAQPGSRRRKRIGEVHIERIGCGFKKLKKKEKGEGIVYREVNGNRYAVSEGDYNTVFLARTTAKVTWKPRRRGYYSIIAEIEPSEQYTVLDGVMEKKILVRAPSK